VATVDQNNTDNKAYITAFDSLDILWLILDIFIFPSGQIYDFYLEIPFW
jgi:hypothetical protein